MSIYYVYLYRDPITLIPFYIGYGKNDRCLYHLKEAKTSPKRIQNIHKYNKIRKILKEEREPIIEIVERNLSKENACELEIFLIEFIGRSDLNKGPLTNKTDGGDGNVNWSPELRRKMSEKRKGLIHAKDPKTGETLRVDKDDQRWIDGELVGRNFGEVNSNVNGRLDNYILAKNRKTGEVVRIKSDSSEWLSGEFEGFHKGKPCHENTKAAARRRKGQPKSEETKIKMSEAMKGKQKSEEHKKKLSQIQKSMKWYCDFSKNEVRKFVENQQPDGFTRVSGPKKKTII